MEGIKIIELLEQHVLNMMQELDQCQPGGPGTTNKEIELVAGLALNLPDQDGWLTWSILQSLLRKGLVEAVATRHGKVTRHRYRLSSPSSALGE
ncbi:MAG: hypothetical protein QMC81_00555 [Thermoanaerobacterales bacterium]|nr:hypothetical protein [Thermoanaerobacterales bacterium]